MSQESHKKALGTLLLVEDDLNLGSTLKERLLGEGFEVVWERTSQGVERAMEQMGTPVVALLDVQLKGSHGDGFDVARFLRKSWPEVPLVFLTAFASPDERVRGFELGAADYISKPFHFKELHLRLMKVVKQHTLLAEHLPTEPWTMGSVEFWPSRFEILMGAETPKEKIQLSQKENSLLKLLFLRRGQVVSRDEILDRVWATEEGPTERTIDNFIMRFRKILGSDAIRSVRGVGYCLELGSERRGEGGSK